MGTVHPLRLTCGSLALALLVPSLVIGSAAPEDDDIQAVLARLHGLDFDTFVDESYKQILLRSPETVTSLGLSAALGIRNDRLDDICGSFVEGTYELKAGILEILETYDRAALAPGQQTSLDSYAWLLSAWEDEQEFMCHLYPVTHAFSRQNDIERFLTDEHPMASLQDAEDYVSRLEQVDDQFACLVQNLQESQDRGIMAPAQMLVAAAYRIRGIMPGTATGLPFYTAFAAKLDQITELSQVQRQHLLSLAEQAIDSSVIPAYQRLVEKLDQQIPVAPPMNGVWQLPDGDRFYRSQLRFHTTTDLSPEAVHQLGLQEVARIRSEIRQAFDGLGYPSDQGFAELFQRLAQDSGIIPADQIVAHADAIIRQALADSAQAFDIAPRTPVVVIGGTGTFYVPGSLDGSRPGAYYVANAAATYRYSMRTIAYHEAVPGHHFQISIGNEQDVPLFTKAGNIFTGFVEGWAVYAEYLAKDLDWYRDDVHSDLGRLQWELLRAVRMVVDTGLHARRWSRGQAIEYYVETVGADVSLATSQIDLYLSYPGHFSAYKTGMMKILELRQLAEDRLGDRFDLKDFHRVVLLRNRMPLSLLERAVCDYIETGLVP
jgi:uncharacterized protein (DUF885 family)